MIELEQIPNDQMNRARLLYYKVELNQSKGDCSSGAIVNASEISIANEFDAGNPEVNTRYLNGGVLY